MLPAISAFHCAWYAHDEPARDRPAPVQCSDDWSSRLAQNKLVPRSLELEDRSRRERGARKWEHHAPERLEGTGAVELRRLLEVTRDRQEVLPHEKQRRGADQLESAYPWYVSMRFAVRASRDDRRQHVASIR